MLRSLHDLQGFTIRATDGDIGHVKDFYIDDQAWVVRYLVVETGGWLTSRKVLVSPFAIGEPDWQEKTLPVSITRDQVGDSPGIDTDKPVSRQHEEEYHTYYAYPLYWSGLELWGAGTHPNLAMPLFVSTPSVVEPQPDSIDVDAPASRLTKGDSHLRSCTVVMGYHIHANDGDIGHVQALLVDDETWAIRYLVVNTSNWWIGHQVLVTPEQIRDVSWLDETISLNLNREEIKSAPPYDASSKPDRAQELSQHEHYGNMAYWERERRPLATRAAAAR